MDARSKVWQRLRQTSRRGLERITVEDSPVLASGDIELDQLTVLTGSHGAGKSYLLRVLDAALPWGYSYPIGPPFNWFKEVEGSDGSLLGTYRFPTRIRAVL